MSKTFPPEIIREIVLYLKDDKKSLYSCLLVSRDWCREAVRLLWRQPFHFLYACSTLTSSKLKRIKRPKCHCSKKKLKSQGGNLLMIYLSIKYSDELVKEGIIKTKDIMFNYLEFLCALDIRQLFIAIKDWNSLDYDGSDFKEFLNTKFDLTTVSIDFVKIIWRDIFEFLFTNSSKLESLSLDIEAINPYQCLSSTYYDDIIVNELLIGKTKAPEIKQVFASLTEFVFTTRTIKTELFSFLSQNCHNIQKLIVKIKVMPPMPPKFTGCGRAPIRYLDISLAETKQLASLIRSQRNLVHFELFDTIDESTGVILKALGESQCNSLKAFILNRVFISDSTILCYLKYLQNLQELKINKCYAKGERSVETNGWEDLWLPNLKYLGVSFVGKQYNDLTSILLASSPLL